MFHRLVWIKHFALLYVDDLLWIQETKTLRLTAAYLSIFCQAIGLPISWKKCELSSEVKWIGWMINAHCGIITLPTDKRDRLLELIRDLMAHTKVSKKHLEQFIGLAMWITSLFPHMRVWLHSLYQDLHSIAASLFSIDPGHWDVAVSCLSPSLHFERSPPGSGIPINGKLISVRHQPVATYKIFNNVYFPSAAFGFESEMELQRNEP